ncbi:MAG: chorismate-binding protein [Gammaproteobacteria bacterium]|nr:chorismate-binding protein [Gammaproteobacteria bacterium]
MITRDEYRRLARQGYTHIPLVHEVPADLDTPVGVYMKLANHPYSYLLESVSGGEHWGRYSIIGLDCRRHIRVCGRRVAVHRDGRIDEQHDTDDPLAWIERYAAAFRVPQIEAAPRFIGGLVGYFGYETVHYIEPRLAGSANPDELGTPDILLLVSEQVAVFDNLRGTLSLIVLADTSQDDAWQRARERLAQLEQRLREPLPPPPTQAAPQPPTQAAPQAPMQSATVPPPMQAAPQAPTQAAPLPPTQAAPQAPPTLEHAFVSSFGRDAFLRAVGTCRDYIAAGDAMQIVLSQRLKAPFRGADLNFYRALRRLNPSPYMYYLDLEDFRIVGSSPEILVRLEDGQLTLRPIAGTRPRGRDHDEDLRLERELLADAKELAEHLMLIDLGRNDLGRIAQTGSVRVTERMIVERYSHVMHIVSNVTAQKRNGVGPMDALRAAFPAGTLSGAPKIRAMEIIAELEPVKRNIYAGAVGYIGWNGTMDTAIAIRTAVIKDGALIVQAGAGLVYDSRPEREWEETMSKARAMFEAAAIACELP